MKLITKIVIILLGAVFITAPKNCFADFSSVNKDTNNYERIFHSKGVVRVRVFEMLGNNNWDDVIIYNKDGSIYAFTDEDKQMFTIDNKKYKYKYSITEEKAFKDELEKKFNFRVKEFLLTGSNIEFECKSIEKDRYEIFINKEKGITKFVKTDKHIYSYEPWPEYLYKYFISFDRSKLMKNENGVTTVSNKKEISLYDFKAVEIKGKWMKIKAVNSDCKKIKQNSNDMQGWINWYNGKKVLIDTYPDCKIQKLKEKLLK